jgi:predicted GNAT family N-acyltransferase
VVVRRARDEREIAAALDLRKRVFCGEQGVPLVAERDGRDPEALHVVASDEERLVGTCRLVFDGEVAKLGRMAVEPEARGRGVGVAILAAAERFAREAGARRITLHAQTAVKDLYSRHGFIPHGEPFVEEGIDHVAMEKVVA